MIPHENLKYAKRAGDCMIITTIHTVENIERRGELCMRKLHITDGHQTIPLILFGDMAQRRYTVGQRIRVGPTYYSENWENFVLTKGGSIS